jgi:osmotically inducible protein OsmC
MAPEGLNMPTRTAHARCEGTIKEGKGSLDFGNGAFKGAYVRGIDPESFQTHAETAKVNCPVSQALAGTEITLQATLADRMTIGR